MTVSTIVPMTGSYDHLQVALSVLLAVFVSYTALDLAGRLRSAVILINFNCMNCWGPATARASHWQEVVC
ncbi:MAG TPA: MHYT domain-containing protein [Terriglobales bacterium]|nr:MHYT domain-containing protein [Terriglobales bacterium]